MEKGNRIVFMGTPDFAVPSLQRLVEGGYNVVGVITATDKLGGRGRKKLIESPVKKLAITYDIPVLQPKNLKSQAFNEALRELNPDLQIVVAFRMLPEVVWSLPTMGTFNLHGSLLPKYRGAAPINWAIIKGEKETGLTTFFIKKDIDTGDILFQTKLPIGDDETAGELHDRMMVAGAELVIKTTKAILENKFTLQKQNESEVSQAPKIFAEDCEISWQDTTENVYNLIRGLSPYPGSWTHIDDKVVKIIRCQPKKIFGQAGSIVTNQKDLLLIHCLDGSISIDQLKMEGKQNLLIQDFLNGYKIQKFKTD